MKSPGHERPLVILDMDGVVTSERGYWDAVVCTMVEFLASCENLEAKTLLPKVLNAPESARQFLDDQLIAKVKNRSTNTNWDLAFMAVAWHLVDLLAVCQASHPTGWSRINTGNFSFESLKSLDPQSKLRLTSVIADEFFASAGEKSGFELIAHLEFWAMERLGIPLPWLKRSGGLWNECFALFQHSYLGTDAATRQGFVRAGSIPRKGIVYGEPLVIDAAKIQKAISEISETCTLGIGTGRCEEELEIPLEHYGLKRFFDPQRIVTHDQVALAEKELPPTDGSIALSKPHPYGFLKAIYPNAATVPLAKLDPQFLNNSSTVIVGDTVGDIRAGKMIHAITVAVLTGVAGELGRARLLEAGAEHIIADISELPALLKTIFVP